MKLSVANPILNSWPHRTNTWTAGMRPGYWVKVRPTQSGPQIHHAGCDTHKTQPDAMYAYLGGNAAYADVIVVEVCNSLQNLYDKRSRYAPSTSAWLLRFREGWFDTPIPVRKNHAGWPAWRAFGTLQAKPASDLDVPCRFVRVLYVIPDALLQTWRKNHVPTGHEYFVKDSSFATFWTNPRGQALLKSMTLERHFY